MLIAFESIPTLDPEQPLRALSLPAWLQRCVNALTADFMKPMIPADLALSDEQRAAVTIRVEEIGKAEMMCDVDHTMALVVDLLDAFPSTKLSEEQQKSKARGYMTALEGMPTWAVAEAGRRWLQAKAGAQNYDFAPSPPRLREISDDVLAEVRGQSIALRRLLNAKPEVPFEYGNPRVIEGFKDLLRTLKKTNVVA
jgi:hypothetical protein